MNREGDTIPGSLTTLSGRILCQRGDGIGCRLLTLLWTLRLARTADAGVVMFWPSLELFYQGTVAADLFDPSRLSSGQLQIVDGDCRSVLRPRQIVLSRKERYAPADLMAPPDADPGREKLPVIVGHWEGPFLAPGESREAALAQIPGLFSELPFRSDLLEEIDRIAGGGRLSDAVAVHVRRGEIVANLRTAVAGFRSGDAASEQLLGERAGTFFRRCLSVRTLAESLGDFVDQGRRILVFSDEPGAHAELSAAVGGAEALPVASLIQAYLTPIQQAFVEVVLMSRCGCMVGARSGYGELAHVIGGQAQVCLDPSRRPAGESAAFMLATVADQLAAHPEGSQLERRLHGEVVRLRG